MDRKMTRQPVGQISSALAGSGALIARTGKSVLSFWGLKSNLFVEFLIGLVVWAIIGIVLTVFIAVFFAKP
jgi:hypothetical protein